jgi:DnaJ family protein C protein 7
MASAADRSSMDIDSPASPSQKTNGVNGAQTDRTPTPPPHKSNGSVAEADSFKLAGNKFFKDGNYNRAIEEFTKGEYTFSYLKYSTKLIG